MSLFSIVVYVIEGIANNRSIAQSIALQSSDSEFKVELSIFTQFTKLSKWWNWHLFIFCNMDFLLNWYYNNLEIDGVLLFIVFRNCNFHSHSFLRRLGCGGVALWQKVKGKMFICHLQNLIKIHTMRLK